MWSSEVFASLDPAAPPRPAGTWRLDELELPQEEIVVDGRAVSPFEVFTEVDTEGVLPRNRADAERIAEAFEHGRADGIATATAGERARVETAIASLELVLGRFAADRSRWRANAAG